MSAFPAHITAEVEHGSEVHEFIPSQTAAETGRYGELMYFDTADQKLKRCGADPALIAGISEVSTEAARLLTPDGKVPHRLLKPNGLVRMSSTTTPAETHMGQSYGVTRDANGNWQLDTAKTGGSARVIVKKIDIGAGAFFVTFIAANLQFDAIAS